MKYSLFFYTCFLILLLGLRVSTKAIEVNERTEINQLIEDGCDEEDIFIYTNSKNIEKDIDFDGKEYLDVYYNRNDTTNKKPVVIFVYGGSWVTGNKVRYAKFGVLLEHNGYVGVLPDYTLYPKGSVEDMVDNVYHAIQWTYKNIEKYGGDPNQIILSAHSAGSHLSALTIVKSTLHLKNNGVALDPLPYLKKVVLMNGPYILNDEMISHAFGKSITNLIHDLFKGNPNPTNKADSKQYFLVPQFFIKHYKNNNISPISLLKKVGDNAISNHFNVGSFTFFYTSDDEAVPKSSSLNLINEINRTSQNAQCKYVYREGLRHATLLFGINKHLMEFEMMYLDLLKN